MFTTSTWTAFGQVCKLGEVKKCTTYQYAEYIMPSVQRVVQNSSEAIITYQQQEGSKTNMAWKYSL